MLGARKIFFQLDIIHTTFFNFRCPKEMFKFAEEALILSIRVMMVNCKFCNSDNFAGFSTGHFFLPHPIPSQVVTVSACHGIPSKLKYRVTQKQRSSPKIE